MSSLAYRNMNFTLQERQQLQDQKDHEWYMSLPIKERQDHSHYWAIYRKAKRATKKNGGWILITYVQATKGEIARIWEHYRGKSCRLRHVLSYSNMTIKK